MQCPECGERLPETGTQCPACSADVAWHIRKPDGSVYGPFDVALIEQCIREGRVVPGDMVQFGSGGQFRPAHELLGDRLVAPPPPTTAATVPAAGGVSPETRRWVSRGCAIAAGVFGLVCVLAALASIPVYRSARSQARQALCQANLKQVNLALLMYASDHDDLCPPKGDWQPRLDPYLRNSRLWICPACPNEPGYAKNDKLAGVKTPDVRQPDQTLTLWDAGANVQGFPPPPGTTSPRHRGSDNFAFADGHAKAAQPGQLQAYTDP